MGLFDKIKTFFKSELPPEKPFLDDYTIIKQMIGGTMSSVYLAKNKKTKDAALIKKVRPKDKGGMNALARELEITIMLNNPGIAKTFGYEKRNNEYYILMEFVPGYSLRDYIKYKVVLRGMKPPFLPSSQYTQVFLELAEMVRYIHSMQVLHMDIKPENVLVVKHPSTMKPSDSAISRGDTAVMLANVLQEQLKKDEEQSKDSSIKKPSGLYKGVTTSVKLVDFGVAVRFSEIEEAKGGSLFYVAPEIFLKDRLNFIGPRIDIYSLGATMFELACGEPPFLPSFFDNKEKNWLFHWADYQKFDPYMKKHMEADLIKTKQTREPAINKISYHSNIREIIKKCITIDLSKRYTGADQLVSELLEIKDHVDRGLY